MCPDIFHNLQPFPKCPLFYFGQDFHKGSGFLFPPIPKTRQSNSNWSDQSSALLVFFLFLAETWFKMDIQSCKIYTELQMWPKKKKSISVKLWYPWHWQTAVLHLICITCDEQKTFFKPIKDKQSCTLTWVEVVFTFQKQIFISFGCWWWKLWLVKGVKCTLSTIIWHQAKLPSSPAEGSRLCF